MGIVISHLSGTFAKTLALGTKFLQESLKQSLKFVGKGAFQGKHKQPSELELIQDIVAAANQAAHTFVEKATLLVDFMPDAEAAADARMLVALKASPAVEEESFEDDRDDGQVARGAENQFLEAAGAPVTGPAEAEGLAVAMMQSYKAERIHLFSTIGERTSATKDALSDRGVRQIKDAEKRTNLEESVNADKAERKRASELHNPMPGTERPQKPEEEPAS